MKYDQSILIILMLFIGRYLMDPMSFKQNIVQIKLKCPKPRTLLGKTSSCVKGKFQQLVMVTAYLSDHCEMTKKIHNFNRLG